MILEFPASYSHLARGIMQVCCIFQGHDNENENTLEEYSTNLRSF